MKLLLKYVHGLDNGVKLAIVSDGAHGSFYGYHDQIKHIPAYQAEEIDATGAGDAMTAGFITRLLESQAGEVIDIQDIDEQVISQSLRFASVGGAVAVETMGCIGDISRVKVENMMNRVAQESL